ncbi:MAG TPA: DUF4190 domain-containing protein [Methanocorpusculum sp.]|nr:DUF4190 domain-containing protein [Methanocorpusculum sp.]
MEEEYPDEEKFESCSADSESGADARAPADEQWNAEKNGFAIAALVLGIVGVLLACSSGFGIAASILAIVFGKLALTRREGSETMANAGFILGIVGTALNALVLVFVFLTVISVFTLPFIAMMPMALAAV